nr:tetratricopeptide repeat protein [Pyrinomonadaceae bacterium]
LLLADCHLRTGEHKKVTELLTPLEPKQPDNRALAYLLGSALIRDGQTEQGQRIIDRILRDGESAEARLLLGTAQLMARDYAGATKDLARAVELNPKLPSVHSYYGRALLETGNPAQALDAFRRELEVNPNDFDSNLYTGVLLKQEAKNDEALKYLERALSVRPGALDVRYQIGALLFAANKIAEAQGMLEGVVKEAPNFVEAHVTLATVYYRQKRKEDGDRHRAIVQKLNAEAQSRAPGAQDNLGPGYRGEGASDPPAAAKPQAAKP